MVKGAKNGKHGAHEENHRALISSMLDQPLSALPHSINAYLKRQETTTDVEARSIFEEVDVVFRRCEDALSLDGDDASTRDTTIVCCCQLLQRGFATAPEVGLAMFAEREDELFKCLDRLLESIVMTDVGSIEAQIEVLQVIDNLCEGSPTKDRSGASFIPPLLDLLGDKTRIYRVHRAAATALINAVKCSQTNKNRMGNLEQLANAMTSTADFFLQLQCVELLFRITRRNKALMQGVVALPESVRCAIQQLPNDRSLLGNMINIVDEWNAERTPPLVLRFPVQRVDGGSTTICAATVAYFSPSHFLFLLDGQSAENITIPYTSVRSVKIAKEAKISFKLLEIPPRLSCNMATGSNKEGEDVLTLFATGSVISSFRQSSVHQWIVDVLRLRQSPDARFASKRARIDGDFDGPSPSHDAIESLAAVPVDVSTVRLSSGIGSRLTEQTPISSAKKKARYELQRATPQRLELQPAQTPMLMLYDPIVKDSVKESGVSKPEAIATKVVSESRIAPARVHTAEDEAEDLVRQLKTVIDDKVSAKRREAAQVLNGTVAVLQTQIDESRAKINQEREAFFGSLRERLEQHKAMQIKIHDKVANVVEELNRNLQEIKKVTQCTRDQQSCLEIEFPQTIASIRADEDELLCRIKNEVETQTRQLEMSINRRIAEGNPLKFVASFVGRKMEQDTFC